MGELLTPQFMSEDNSEFDWGSTKEEKSYDVGAAYEAEVIHSEHFGFHEEDPTTYKTNVVVLRDLPALPEGSAQDRHDQVKDAVLDLILENDVPEAFPAAVVAEVKNISLYREPKARPIRRMMLKLVGKDFDDTEEFELPNGGKAIVKEVS